jgi:hypothetical protein
MSVTRIGVTFEEVPSLKGLALQGEWFKIAGERVEAFNVGVYADEYSEAFAEWLYPKGLVEGFHLVALLDHLTNRILRTDPASCTGWNYGLNRVRFITPVTVEDAIRLNLTVKDVVFKDPGYVLTLACVAEHSSSAERPAFTAEWLVYWQSALPGQASDDGSRRP